MDATFRVSVRDLVGFTYFCPDILPASGMAELLAGTKAHQARESAQAEQFEIEKPIRADVDCEGVRVTVFGRMDAYREGDPPCVEEIKLCRKPPEAALPEHMAQARLYGALLMVGTPYTAVELHVTYVDEQGIPLRMFVECMERAPLAEVFHTLLAPWLAFAVSERERARLRDVGIRAAGFPFAGYRMGQRELAAQAYTAIVRRKRLFASLPTGTGKSAAVLFPALKALAEGKTHKIVYLTARTTARQSPLNALSLMRAQGMPIRVSTVLAKEKLCPMPARCHPDDCARAKGHFLRQSEAVQALLGNDAMWTDAVITQTADAYLLCPFELALTLCDLADVVFMDMNYAFDPFAQIARLFKRRKDFTLLVDEAHHLLDRVRDSLSGSLDTRDLRKDRALFGKSLGRRHPYHGALTALLKALGTVTEGDMPSPARAVGSVNMLDPFGSAAGEGGSRNADAPTEHGNAADPAKDAGTQTDVRRAESANAAWHTATDPREASGAMREPRASPTRETRIPSPPAEVVYAAQALCEATFALLETRLPDTETRQAAGRLIRRLSPFLYAAEHFDERYAALLTQHNRERALELYCLSPAETVAAVTKGLRGSVFFSATLAPLEGMRELLGGTAEDACFALPSPFPTENLAVVRRRLQTRYAYRADTAARVAGCIAEAMEARPGKYIAYFPSYAYLRLVYGHLAELSLPPLLVQESEMSEEARTRFMQAFTQGEGATLGLCVLGGLFAEGVDLPGEQLIGAMIVGVGLPTPSLRLKTLQAFYDDRFGDGFLYAWMIPAMQKVAQAGGRIIRTERDRGLLLLLDDRYFHPRYTCLLPPHWRLTEQSVATAVRGLRDQEEP